MVGGSKEGPLVGEVFWGINYYHYFGLLSCICLRLENGTSKTLFFAHMLEAAPV